MSRRFEAMSEKELAGLTRAGCVDAFDELVGRFERRIYAFLANRVANRVDARELTQETFVKAFQAIGQYDARYSFAAWLFTIARRKSIDRHRSAPRLAEEPVPDGIDFADPSQLLAQKEENRLLWGQARQCLPKTQFEALWLRYVEDMDVAQIAQVLRKTRVHVKVLLFRARENLANRLSSAAARAQSESLTSTQESGLLRRSLRARPLDQPAGQPAPRLGMPLCAPERIV